MECLDMPTMVTETVKEEECHTENDCQTSQERKCQVEMEDVCTASQERQCSVKQDCQTVYQEVCETKMNKECRLQEREVCNSTPQQECKVKCPNTYINCHISILDQEVPTKKCATKTVRDCKQVMKKVCENVQFSERCLEVPAMECTDTPQASLRVPCTLHFHFSIHAVKLLCFLYVLMTGSNCAGDV